MEQKSQGQTTTITKEEIDDELFQAFRMYDKDEDGQITVEELGKVMSRLGQDLSEKEIKEMISQVDTDGSGSINFNEFKAMMEKKLEDESSDEDMMEVFKMFDKDNDGKISKKELKEMMISLGENLSDRDVQDMMIEADTNKDGFVDFNEFKAIMLAV